MRYHLRFIPPLTKGLSSKNENKKKQQEDDNSRLRKIRYFNKFMNAIIQKKILRTSPILLQFLTLNNDEFKKYTKKLNQKKVDLEMNFSNLITLNEKNKYSLENDSISEANKMSNKFTSLNHLFNKVHLCVENITNDYQNLVSHMRELSSHFNSLIDNMNNYSYSNIDEMKNNFNELKNIFNNWSNCLENQSDFLNTKFRENFHYMGLEIEEMNSIFSKYKEYKKEYEEFNSMIHRKKEELFRNKNTDKWGVEPGTEKEIPSYKDDKKVAFEKMLYKENKLLVLEKQRVCVVICKMNKQYENLIKVHNEEIKKIYDLAKNSIVIDFKN